MACLLSDLSDIDRALERQYSGSPVKSFSREDRKRNLSAAAEATLDIIVVGGGITGAGVAREAALRGMSVLLLDKGDFASGTSSRSSKLIHGGVRYLEQGDVALVREAARERAVLRRIAPHLTHPARMLIPARSTGSRLKLAAGLWTFDKLAGDTREDAHVVYDREKTMRAEPGLRAEQLAGAVLFTEYVTIDSRLTLETIRGAADFGALAANYARVDDIEHRNGLVHVSITDLLSRESLVARARCLVNAAGPWFDRVRSLSDSDARPIVQLTRGIHIVVPREKLPVDHIVVLRAPDNRSTFVVPRGRYAYVGTTDTMYEGCPEEPGVTAADVCYLLDSVAATLRNAPEPCDVVGVWSGVRPLLRQQGKKPSEISRRDEIRVGPGPYVSIAGGKLTTYRRMAERVVESAIELLGKAPLRDADSSRVALPGGDEGAQRRARASANYAPGDRVAERLWNTYGAIAGYLLTRMRTEPASAERIGGLEDLTEAELEYFVEYEMALTVDDVLRRRSQIGLLDTSAAVHAAAEVSVALGERLGWDAVQSHCEAKKFAEDRERELEVVRSISGYSR